MSNLNETPKVTDFANSIFPAQQANESGNRHLTGAELAEKIKINQTVNGQRIPAVAPGALPAGPAGQDRFMIVRAVGTWTFGGNPVGSNADGYETTFWWNGSTWIDNGSAKIKGDSGDNGTNGTTNEPYNASRVGGYSAGDVIIESGVTYQVRAGQSLDMGEAPSANLAKVDIVPIKAEDEELNAKVAIIDNVIKPDNHEDGYYITDINGNVVFKVSSNGFASLIQDLENLKSNLERAGFTFPLRTTDYIFENAKADEVNITDLNGEVVFKITKSGLTSFIAEPKNQVYNIQKTWLDKKAIGLIDYPDMPSDIVHFIGYGQSLSVLGYGPYSENLGDALTFSGGVLTDYDPDVSGAEDTYFGSDFITLQSVSGGTMDEDPFVKYAPIAFKKNLIKENFIDTSSTDYQFLVSSAGQGSLGIAALSNKSGDQYRRLIKSVEKGKEFANANGQTYSVPAIFFCQGETDNSNSMSKEDYKTAVLALFNELENDIKAITNQPNDIVFITYQTAGFSGATLRKDIPYAFLELANENENIYMGSAMYQYPYVDTLHLDNRWYRHVGATMGIVAKRILVDKKREWSHLKVTNKLVSGNIIQLTIDAPVLPLRINTSFYSAQPNYGFSMLNEGVEMVESVSIVRGNTIKIVCNGDPMGRTLTYANNGRLKGGNISDSQGLTESVELSNGVSYPVDNWLPIFEVNFYN